MNFSRNAGEWRGALNPVPAFARADHARLLRCRMPDT